MAPPGSWLCAHHSGPALACPALPAPPCSLSFGRALVRGGHALVLAAGGSPRVYAWHSAAAPLTAEKVEAALASAAYSGIEERCAGTAGGWCPKYLNQAPITRPSRHPPAEKRCPKDCSGNGVCNAELGACRCVAWFTGPACETPFKRRCNHPITTVSRCPGVCDERMVRIQNAL